MRPAATLNGAAEVSPADLERLPPCDLDAERAVLACVLMDAGTAAVFAPRIRPEDFHDTRHRRIAEAIRAVDGGGAVPDGATVAAEMRKRGTWQDCEEVVRGLVDAVATPGNAAAYLATVTEKAEARRLLSSVLAAADCIRSGESVATVVGRVRDSLTAQPNTGKTSRMPEPMTCEEIIEKGGEKVPVLVHGYIPENAVVMLSGGSGVGKSYLLAYLLACGERGEPFLTHPVQEPFGALWFTEEPPAFLAQKIRRFGLKSVAFFGRDHLDVAPPWPELVAEGADLARRTGRRLVIFDPFPTWARHEGDAEQSSGAMTAALGTCLAVAKDGLTVALTTHDTRAGNPFRGSGAIKGALDVGLWLRLLDPTKPDGPRVLSIEKDRPYFGTPAATIALDGAGYRLLGDPDAAKVAEQSPAGRRLLAEAGEGGLSGRAFYSALGVRADLGYRILHAIGRSTGAGNRQRWFPREAP